MKVARLIRLASVLKRYVFVTKLLPDKNGKIYWEGCDEIELDGKKALEEHLKPGDIIRLPGDGLSMAWDGCYSFKVLPNL